MSRHHSTETFQMDIRSSPSQQNLDPLNSRSSSIRSHEAEDENDIGQETGRGGASMMNSRKHKLDLYSIPVFLLEVLILCGLTYAAHYIHFQYHNDSFADGFYCDDITLRQQYNDEGSFVHLFNQRQNELTFVVMLLVIPVVLIIFCELVNSMFGALKFRQVRALCKCCKLHSITRRSIRFSGAFILGFLICMISCDILATTSGRLRPYFAQECPAAYRNCLENNKPTTSNGATNSLSTSFTSASTVSDFSSLDASPVPVPVNVDLNPQAPPSKPINPSPIPAINSLPANRSKRAIDVLSANKLMETASSMLERHWIDLGDQELKETCQFSQQHTNSDREIYKFNQLAKSWPSFPATMITYSCLYLAFYLSFVGTARPFRMISSLIVVALLLSATGFNVLLVKYHYQHWQDVAGAAVLALVTVIFVLLVYLNRFRDSHYYENQKLSPSRGRQVTLHDSFKNYSGGMEGNYKAAPASTVNLTNGAILQNGVDTNGTVSNNDLAMRYFQIPRANYRGAPRPISSLQQMRS